jgi:hypothetical protein
MRIPCCISKAKITYSAMQQITLPLQQLLQEHASVLRYMYIACLVLLHSWKSYRSPVRSRSCRKAARHLLKHVYISAVAIRVTKAVIERRWKWYFELHTNYLLMVYCKLCIWKGVDFPINVSKQFSNSFANYNHFIYKIETKFAE